ncbi:MAG: mechanosensitive ion channel [Burkholderiales bacterium]|nr:mechanosensitive ion channel [Burkholderiales bacterium]
MSDQGMSGWSLELLGAAKQRLEALGLDLARAPEEARRAAEAAHATLMSGAGVRSATYLLLILFIGIAVEWLYWTYAYSPLRAAQSAPALTPLHALRLGLRLLLLRGSGLLLFTAAALGASAAFTWPPHVHPLVVFATLFLLVLRAAWMGVGILIAPGRPHRRLVPVAPRAARWLAAALLAAIFLLACGSFLPAMVESGGVAAHHIASALRLAAYTAAAALLVALSLALFGRPGSRGAAGAARAPLFPRSFPLAMLVVFVYAVWLLSPRAAPVAAILAVVVGLQIGLHDMVYFYWHSEDETAGKPADREALPAIALSLARFVVALAGIGAAALALDTPVSALAESSSPWVGVGLRLLGVAVLALLAHGVWIAVRSVVDQRLSRIAPADPHQPPDASSRLLTLLPLLRVTTAVVLLVLLVLSSLWALGIEITPLLAGAGVVGLALGFGAQALVRDVIAGVFYLAEDAFRVGEYVEGAGNTKGTVERITLRSVALRHHNGPLHFVPYGALGSVRNTSRDWVIDKFNLPLPIEVESEKIRKMIKKIGEQLKEDTALGQHLMEPLKGKLYRVDPGVKVFRCKFRCPPGKQFDLRAAALKRIEAALKEMGLGYAAGVNTVIVKG